MICQDPTNFLLYGNRNLSMEKSPLDEFPIKRWEWLLVTRGYHCQLLEIHRVPVLPKAPTILRPQRRLPHPQLQARPRRPRP